MLQYVVVRDLDPRLQGENYSANLRAAKIVADLAAARGLTASQVALAWVQQQGNDIVPIPGTKRRSYLEQNVGACQVTLDQQEIASLEQAFAHVSGERYSKERMAWIDR